MFNPQSETASGSFFMGVFTAILSTPCTGPLLGATIAWVATQPSIIAFLTLLVMGVGMAFPYVLLTAKPAWLERLPRTGPGSELVKQVMGLLLLAVATWFLGTAALSFSARGEASATSGEEQTMIAVAHDRTASCADQFDSPGYRAITSPKLRS
jgi:thiol:disulfide interchange protein DsbD